MHFLVLKESEQKCARAFYEKCGFFDSTSMLTSLTALEHFPGTLETNIKKIHLKA